MLMMQQAGRNTVHARLTGTYLNILRDFYEGEFYCLHTNLSKYEYDLGYSDIALLSVYSPI